MIVKMRPQCPNLCADRSVFAVHYLHHGVVFCNASDAQLSMCVQNIFSVDYRVRVCVFRSDLAYSARSRSEERTKPLGGITL